MYRGHSARNRPRNGNGNANGRRNPHLRRVAIQRIRARPRSRGPRYVYPLTALFGIVGAFALAAFMIVMGIATGLSFLNQMEAELPSVGGFEDLEFAQPSVIYDRTGTVELARFQVERRRVVDFETIPKVLLDSTIAVEDRSFWQNEGYDPNAIMAAVIESITGVRDRGASTITQQFVRARLLPQEVLEGDIWVRKVKEILQARNLTLEFPGEEGKERILTAYLNQIYYGHQAYGIAAAAEVYFGVTDLKLLTPSQAATLAGLAQAPDTYDLYKWARRDSSGRLVVPTQSIAGEQLPPPIERRNFILGALADGHGHYIRLTAEQLEQSLREPIVLIEPEPVVFKAPHFVWYAKAQLDALLADRAPAERGGYRVITSLDMRAQELAETFVTAGTIYTNLPPGQMIDAIEAAGLEEDRRWIESLHGLDIRNGALVAMDARTGEILAHVGSAGYYRDDLKADAFDPKFDVAGHGYRQPGSAWKPLVYAAAFDQAALTPGSLLLDVTTEFARGWFPRNADVRERGPVLVRDALNYSLNIPAIRALDRVGVENVAALADQMGLTFARGDRHLAQAGLAGAIGTAETNMVELTSAFGALANSGAQMDPHPILQVFDSEGNELPIVPDNAPRQVISEQASWLVTDILKDSTDPAANTVFGPRLQIFSDSTDPLQPDGVRRFAAAKTGTTNDLRDLSVYGYLGPPADPGAPHVVASVWLGNSDHSPPNGGDIEIIAADGPGRIWSAFLRELSESWPNSPFPSPPQGVVASTIDMWSGGAPGPWTRETRVEYFIEGTQPGGLREVDERGLLYRQMCNRWFVDIVKVEQGRAPERWILADIDWMDRARRGPGRRGEHNSSTAYLRGRGDWGGFIAPVDCASAPTQAPPTLPPLPQPSPTGLPPAPPPEQPTEGPSAAPGG